MALSRSRRESMNYWPGFVDALSTLVLSIIFLLTVFMVAEFFLSQEMAGKDTALQNLNAKILQLSQLLSLEQTGKTNLEDQVTQLRASLSAAEDERNRLRSAADAAGAGPNPGSGQGEVDNLNSKIDVEKQATARAIAQIENLNEQIKALRSQIASLQEALGSSEQKDKDAQVRIADLGQRLNLALAQRVQELSRYRSDFFGKLREILGNRPDIRVVGDATALLDLDKQIPPEINWVLRVDGHTDSRPVGPPSPFKSNWELSAARAISVVQYLISKGVSPQRLVAAGFGEFQPIDPGTTEDALARNRRIELKLTER